MTSSLEVSPYPIVISKDYDLPKQIWCYWDSGTLPKDIEEYYQNNKSILDDWNITFLTNENLSQYIDVSAIPNNYNSLVIQAKADYIRLAVLYKWGGTWMDASIIVNSKEAMEKLYTETSERKAQAPLFTLGGPRPDPSFIESWFIMAPRESPVIGAWLHEFRFAVEITLVEYERYIHSNKYSINPRIYLPYLTIHACMQVILQKHPELREMMILHPAEDDMYRIHVESYWNLSRIADAVKRGHKHIPYVKLRSIDRGALK
jgi:hypothetical protein